MRIAIIGNGRVATHLSKALSSAGHELTMCGGRVRRCPVPDDAQIVILAIKDDAIHQVSADLAQSNSLVLHTSGSISMDVMPCRRRGVLYPMQTFSLDRELNYRQVPLFLETSLSEDMALLCQLASSISDVQMPMSGEQRRSLHLAAVFACNFVNHLFALSHDILQENNIPFNMLFPLIEETVSKLHILSPHEAQTGPALRWDTTVLQSHMNMITDHQRREIYRLISESIHNTETSVKH